MTTKKHETRLLALRDSLAAVRGDARGVPHALRRQVLEFTAEGRDAGRTARVTAAALGIHETTLCRWARESGAATRDAADPPEVQAFRAVQLASPPASAALATGSLPSATTLRVAHAPSGLVIDGLDVDALARLLRSLS